MKKKRKNKKDDKANPFKVILTVIELLAAITEILNYFSIKP